MIETRKPPLGMRARLWLNVLTDEECEANFETLSRGEASSM